MELDVSRPADVVAPRLLGAVLRHGPIAVRLSEVEAYLGEADPASHARGGPTPRSAVMFGPPGVAYVYLSYGVHTAMNIVCGPEGVASAVLLRAGRIVDGLAQARARRPGVPDARLARGPGCLARALGLGLSLTGCRIELSSGEAAGRATLALWPDPVDPAAIRRGPRVGISRGRERPLRFWIDGDETVSAFRAAPKSRSGRATRHAEDDR